MTFTEWLIEVDDVVDRRTGLSVADLLDADFVEWFDDGVHFDVAAERALVLAGWA